MADIVDPAAVRFANERIRVAADHLAQTYNFARATIDEWAALGGAALIPNTADPVVDGSARDGRPPLTGARCNDIVNRLTELVADFDANGKAKLGTVLRASVNTR